jgi:hypothetical protein
VSKTERAVSMAETLRYGSENVDRNIKNTRCDLNSF